MAYYKLRIDIEEMSTGADSRCRVRFTFRGTAYEAWLALRREALEMAQKVLENPHALELRQFRKDNHLEID